MKVVTLNSPIGDLVSRRVVRVGAAASLGDVALKMLQKDVSAVVVGDHTDVVTERDLTRALAAGLYPKEGARVVAAPHPVRVGADVPVVEAAATMVNEAVRNLVVVMPGGDEAIVSALEVMAVLLQAADPRVWLTSLRVALEPLAATHAPAIGEP